MILGKWHQRRGGKWMVTKTLLPWPYTWDALPEGAIYPQGHRWGTAWFAFLARRRAIAALRRMGGAK